MAKSAESKRKSKPRARSVSKKRPGASSRIFGDLSSVIMSLVNSRKDFGVEKLKSLTLATRSYGRSLADMPVIRAQVDAAAENLQSLSEYITRTKVEKMAADAENYVRSNPIALLAATVPLGVIAVRLVNRQAIPSTAPKKQSKAKNTVKNTVSAKKPKRAKSARHRLNGTAEAHA